LSRQQAAMKMAAATAVRMKMAVAQRAVAIRPYGYPILGVGASAAQQPGAAQMQMAAIQARMRMATAQRAAMMARQAAPAAGPAQTQIEQRMQLAAAQRAVALSPYGYPYVLGVGTPIAS